MPNTTQRRILSIADEQMAVASAIKQRGTQELTV